MTKVDDKFEIAFNKLSKYIQDYMEVGYNKERLAFLWDNLDKALKDCKARDTKLASPIGVIS